MLKSPKAKGNVLEYKFRDMLRESGLDEHAQRMPLSGALAGMKADILTRLPFQFEIKNQEHWSPLAYYNQAKIGINLGSGKIPVVVMKSNRTPIFVMMEGQDWINLAHQALSRKVEVKKVEEFIEKVKQNNPYKEFHPVPKPIKQNKKRDS
jgi:hypothetical protein